MMTRIWLFVRAVLHQWGLLITGVTLTVFLGIFEHYTQVSLSWKAYLFMMSLTVLAACFNAWEAERTGSEEKSLKLAEIVARLSSPELTFEGFSAISVHRVGNKDAGLIVSFSVLNTQGPPTGLKEWSVSVELADQRRVVVGEMPPPTGADQSYRLAADQNLLLKERQDMRILASRAIGSSESISGWLIVFFMGLKLADFDPDKATIVVSCTAILGGKEYTQRIPFPPNRPTFYLPGIGEVERQR